MARLGELLVQQNLVDQDIIDKALKIQIGGNRRLGHVLLKMKAISTDQLAEVLATQLQTPICDIDSSFSDEVKKVIPRYLCMQYAVLPISMKKHNVLELAMSDPSDGEAIRDIEDYTGKAVETRLARHTDILREIPRRIPLGLKDFQSPSSNKKLTFLGIATCLVFTALLGLYTSQYIYKVKYGTISVTTNSTIYKNHDLMVGFDKDGKINLLGRGAHADSYYSASFNTPEIIRAFLENRKDDLSEKQQDWLNWVISQEDSRYSEKGLAAN